MKKKREDERTRDTGRKRQREEDMKEETERGDRKRKNDERR